MDTIYTKTDKNDTVKSLILILFLLIFVYPAFGQEIKITCTNEPLNLVLIKLMVNYGLQLSFNDKQLSGYRITVDQIFSSPEQAFDHLFKGLPLKYERKSDVYLIYSFSKPKSENKPIISGVVIDGINREALPYANVLINNHGLISDFKGNFSYRQGNDSLFRLKISYLGYYILDTTILCGTDLVFGLIPSQVELKEVVVVGKIIEHLIQAGNEPGSMKLNHQQFS